jgi:MoaA/NifB/PqqE/SkfB family radical SAM enzyme
LLTGDLHERCRKCHIREMGPLQKHVRSVFDAVGAGVPLLQSAPLKTARVDINEECNLRCVYCAVSQPNYQGVPMQDDLMDKLSLLLGDYTDLQALDVNGHGETTHHPRWKEFCRPLLDKGIPLTIITNLGRKYTAEDYEVLSRFKVIQISLDTADEALLRDVRRKVDVSRIIYNMAMIRTQALLAGRTPPTMSFSCGVYDLSVVRLEEFAWFAVTQGISTVTFWNLVKYPDVPGAITVRALETLPDSELAAAVACFDRAMAVLDHFQIETEIAGGFIEEFRSQLEKRALAENAV